MRKYPRIFIAGIRGGSGKTLLSLSVIASLKFKKGLKVIPFKKGPDYIDAGWLSKAAENTCYNLDSFFIPIEKIKYSFFKHFKGDIAVIEGNRGLYDGMDASGSYSTAELSKFLRAPVIIVIDCSKATATIAAMVLGCINMDRSVRIGGVVLNQVSGKRHEAVIREAIKKHCHVPVLGAIPRLEMELPERHMGLLPHQEHHDAERVLSIVREIGERYIDIDGIIRVAENAEPLTDKIEVQDTSEKAIRPVRIGVIRDSAFQFYYPENLEELERLGAELIEISALSEDILPDIDAMYIGGGFPETHAITLSENRAFINSLRDTINKGLPVYAECGGLMYLGKRLYLDDKPHEMVNIFPISFILERRPYAHGYTIADVFTNNPFYPSGITIKGHEFHYSRPIPDEEKYLTGHLGPQTINPHELNYAFTMKRGKGIRDKKDGVFYKNVFATYTHVHAYGVPEWTKGMIIAADKFRKVKEEEG